MERPSFQLSVAGLLALVACIALNIWLFRIGPLWGIIGLNISKHIIVAFLCQILGVDRPQSRDLSQASAQRPTQATAR